MLESTPQRHFAQIIFVLVAVAGFALGWNRGSLPVRDEVISDSASLFPPEANIAPDLALYRDVIGDVRQGRGYYESARERIPRYGFPIGSPLNWRLPTYAWLFAFLPGPIWIQAALVGLSLVALALAGKAQWQAGGDAAALLTFLLLIGVVRWALDGHAYLAQEPWSATLLLISLASHRLGGRFSMLAVSAGTLALLFRELALPFCGVALLLATWERRWKEAAGWAAGIGLFCALLAWHVIQVRAQLAGAEVAAGAGLAQWLRLGGLDFVLLTTRMNGLLFSAPGWLLWLYLLVSLLGLAGRIDATSRLACFSALAYLLAFALFGRPENFYWGLLPAPVLAWGTADGLNQLAAQFAERAHWRRPALQQN